MKEGPLRETEERTSEAVPTEGDQALLGNARRGGRVNPSIRVRKRPNDGVGAEEEGS